jgi:chemotaxis response regulator CheB
MARVLIVEDESLIAMMLEDWIVELGHTPVGPAASVDKALHLVETMKPDVAIVDYNLGRDTADNVSELLTARKVPYALASGDRVLGTDKRFRMQPMLSKPYEFERFNTILTALLEQKKVS